MAIEKVITHDVQVSEDGIMNVREITRIMEDGKELTKTYHRHVVDLEDDLTNEPQIVRDVAEGNLRTEDRVNARRAVIVNAEARG
jgi:hypothetical protein